jgi:hypothetical protein
MGTWVVPPAQGQEDEPMVGADADADADADYVKFVKMVQATPYRSPSQNKYLSSNGSGASVLGGPILGDAVSWDLSSGGPSSGASPAAGCPVMGGLAPPPAPVPVILSPWAGNAYLQQQVQELGAENGRLREEAVRAQRQIALQQQVVSHLSARLREANVEIGSALEMSRYGQGTSAEMVSCAGVES